MPARKPRKPPAFCGADLFDPAEQEILRRFFGIPPTLDRSLLAAEPEGEAKDDEFTEPWDRDAAYGVRLGEHQDDTNHPDSRVAVAVARICLHVIGRRPPPRRGRSATKIVERACRDGLFPTEDHKDQHLFSIDWAMGSWVEAYYAVLVPGFDRYVVLKESEAEGTGGPWLALGWFPAGANVLEAVRPIVCDWWDFQAEHSQPHWESFWSAGQVDEETAVAWAAEAWDEWEGHEEEDEEGQEEEAEEEGDQDSEEDSLEA